MPLTEQSKSLPESMRLRRPWPNIGFHYGNHTRSPFAAVFQPLNLFDRDFASNRWNGGMLSQNWMDRLDGKQNTVNEIFRSSKLQALEH